METGEGDFFLPDKKQAAAHFRLRAPSAADNCSSSHASRKASHSGTTPLLPLVWPKRSPQLRPPFARAADGPRAGGLAGEAGHRNSQHVVGTGAVSFAFQ